MSLKIELYPPEFFSEVGKKKTNEDSLLISIPDLESNRSYFLCCDGLGGSPCGGIASYIACQAIAEFLEDNENLNLTDSVMMEGIKYARDEIKAYEMDHPKSRGMKTTVAVLSFHEEGATFTWMGDSRIYQVRDGKILYQTWDHSYVNSLVERGLLTSDERRTHPNRNIITKTLGTRKSDRLPEVKMTKDIRKDDFFLLCTDGLLEQMTDEHIERCLSKFETPESISEKILNHCLDKTLDNFSMILLKIRDIYEVSSTQLSGSSLNATLVGEKGKNRNTY